MKHKIGLDFCSWIHEKYQQLSLNANKVSPTQLLAKNQTFREPAEEQSLT